MRKFKNLPFAILKLLLAGIFILPIVVAIVVSLQSLDEVNRMP